MRVHPSLLGASPFKWGYACAYSIIFAAIFLNALETFNYAPSSKLIVADELCPVVVATLPLKKGKSVSLKNLALASYPLRSVPLDAYKSVAQLQGKVALADIPAAYPLAKNILADEALFSAPFGDPERQGDISKKPVLVETPQKNSANTVISSKNNKRWQRS